MIGRHLKTTYYGHNDPGSPKSILRTTYGSNRVEAIPNIMRRLTQNLDGAVVVECIDTDNYNELVAVVTMWPGQPPIPVFIGNVKIPTLLTDHSEKAGA